MKQRFNLERSLSVRVINVSSDVKPNKAHSFVGSGTELWRLNVRNELLH